MARTIDEIQQSIIAQKNANATLAGLSSNSITAIWRLWAYITAVAMWTLEVLYDKHRDQMNALYNTQHAHTLEWYNTRGRGFMFGKNPENFSWEYDTTGMSDNEIQQAKIVTYAACTRARKKNGKLTLILKVAKGNHASREKLDSVAELPAFKEYMERNVQDAGVDLECVSLDADKLRINLTVYYNPQILDKDGNSLGSAESDVIATALKAYVAQLPFNGLLVPTFLTDALQSVQGVEIPEITFKQSAPAGTEDWKNIAPTGKIAASGWFKFNNGADLNITMIPYGYGIEVEELS